MQVNIPYKDPKKQRKYDFDKKKTHIVDNKNTLEILKTE